MLRTFCLFVLFGTLVGCSPADPDWNKADMQGSIGAYQKFIADHPNDPHAELARSRMQTLQDDLAWRQALSANTMDGYIHYIHIQPMGERTTEARERAADLELNAAQKPARASALEQAARRIARGAEHSGHRHVMVGSAESHP
jgi:hypothetical protein